MRKRIYSYTQDETSKEDESSSTPPDTENIVDIPEISETEDKCKACLSQDSCDNPFDEKWPNLFYVLAQNFYTFYGQKC